MHTHTHTQRLNQLVERGGRNEKERETETEREMI